MTSATSRSGRRAPASSASAARSSTSPIGTGPSTPINLAVDQLASGIPYTFAIELDPSVGNEYQGRKADFSLTWKVSQG